MTNPENPKYNLTILPLWNTQQGNLMGIEVTPEIFAAFQQIEEGGKLMVKFLAEESRKTDNSPHAYLEYLSKQSVREYKNRVAEDKERMTNAKAQTVTPSAAKTL